MSTQINALVPDDFAQAFRDAAREDGCEPAHRLQALARVAERLDLAAEVRAESIAVRDEGKLRQSLGCSAGGRARAAKASKV